MKYHVATSSSPYIHGYLPPSPSWPTGPEPSQYVHRLIASALISGIFRGLELYKPSAIWHVPMP